MRIGGLLVPPRLVVIPFDCHFDFLVGLSNGIRIFQAKWINFFKVVVIFRIT